MKVKNYIIIIIIVLILIGGGYFVYQNISKISTSEIQPDAQTQTDDINCAKKGEFVNPDDLKGKTRHPDVCCAGLKGLIAYKINNKGECEHLIGTPYLTCMPCGDGICETAENGFDENKCNCPEDCETGITENYEDQADKINKIYTVDELVESNVQERVVVLVSGRYTVKLISAGPDYEGPSGGSFLIGETKEIHLIPQLVNVELNEIIIVKGKVRYCGGKKVERYICGIESVDLIEATRPINQQEQVAQQINPNKPVSYKGCSRDDDCKIVKSFQPCTSIEAINKNISDSEWYIFHEDIEKNRNVEIMYRCILSELELDNSKPICQDGLCVAVEKNTEYANENEYCFQGSQLKEKQCALGLLCINQETGEEATPWVSGICK